jgi:predicted DCC family thiol-disulfide oxidoreductase YuxK
MTSSLCAIPLLTVYYDGSCGLCSAEMQEIKRMDQADEVALVDCAAIDFDDSHPRAHGATREALMGALHVEDALGDWHRGVDAIALLYATVGAPWLARAWAHPLTRPITRRVYPWVVRHRYRLSALGLNLIAPRVLRLFATRHGTGREPACTHQDRLPVCSNGRCTAQHA